MLRNRVRRFLSRLITQPTHFSHPELVAHDEVTPMMTKNEFHQRRRVIMGRMINYNAEKESLEPLSEMHGKERMEHVLVLTGASKQRKSGDIDFDFHQYANFNYLTGFIEEDAILVMETIPGKPHPQFKTILFVQPYNEQAQMWTGFRTGPADAISLTGVDEARDIGELHEYLAKYRQTRNARIWGNFLPSDVNNLPLHSAHLHRTISEAIRNGVEIMPVKRFFNESRVIKSEREIEAIKKAATISSEAMLDTMVASRHNHSERHLQATFEFGCKSRGADKISFPSVVAGGERATMLHYESNNQQIEPGQLVLVDGGAQFGHYTCDLARTWPVDGTFTQAQRELYNIVLFISQSVIATLEKGEKKSLDELYSYALVIMSGKLYELGFFEAFNHLETSQEKQKAVFDMTHRLMPHQIGHFIGLDVHDWPTGPVNKVVAFSCILLLILIISLKSLSNPDK